MYEHPLPGKQNTTVLPRIISFAASRLNSSFFGVGAAVFTVNPLAMNLYQEQCYYTMGGQSMQHPGIGI